MIARSFSDWLTHLEVLNKERLRTPYPKRREERFEAVQKIVDALNLLPVVPVITVAGTNGKGSCVAILASILNAAGHRVGAFTSPHLVDYRERIQVNQASLDKAFIVEAFSEIEKARYETVLGYFEFTFLVSLWLFKHSHLDVMVLEVGIGGRCDLVNLVDADIAIITSIDFDHTHILGDNLESIAFEKAGIMRSSKPCVWGQKIIQRRAQSYADTLNAPLFIYGRDFQIEAVQKKDPNQSSVQFVNHTQHLTNLPVPTISYLPNAACALQAISLLPAHLKVELEAIKRGLNNVCLPGRFHVFREKVCTVLDVAHNPASAALLAKNLQEHMPTQRIIMIIAVLNTKDIRGILSPLTTLVDTWYLAELESEQCTPATELAACLESLSSKHYTLFKDVKKAYQAALERAEPDHVIVVMGSFRTVGAVMQLMMVS